MKERPIIFNTEMVQAILDNRKTQTRRVIKPQPTPEPDRIEYYSIPGWGWMPTSKSGKIGIFNPVSYKCPYGKIGDRLWVRETWCAFIKEHIIDSPYAYKADMRNAESEECRQEYIRLGYTYQWKPSIHMPRIASRITLEITDIRGERVQGISPLDAKDEGAISWFMDKKLSFKKSDKPYPVFAFQKLWDSINAKRGYPFKDNSWVWVIQFKKELKQ